MSAVAGTGTRMNSMYSETSSTYQSQEHHEIDALDPIAAIHSAWGNNS